MYLRALLAGKQHVHGLNLEYILTTTLLHHMRISSTVCDLCFSEECCAAVVTVYHGHLEFNDFVLSLYIRKTSTHMYAVANVCLAFVSTR